MRLHHFSVSIAPESLPTAVELFELLGCKVGYRPTGQSWCMMYHPAPGVDLQLSERTTKPITHPKTLAVHVGFISDNPKRVVDQVKTWAASREVAFKSGSCEDTMLWFDLPNVFLDFVIEVMDGSVLES